MANTKACLISCVLFASVLVTNGDFIVETSLGKVSGIEVKSVIRNEKFYSFMGIPYAEPPLGELRFMAPQPHTGWTDILEAKREKKQCPQFNIPSRPLDEYGYHGVEDCLHLSVHTPKLPTNEDLSLPTIVFFYNEQFKVTFNGSRDYGPDFFMKEDVLIVTISYRIGSFGFLSYEDDLLPGNNGLRDVILSLKWIQMNIHKFGGDPYRVTLMGSNGGAAIADLLLQSPKAKGLFSGVILQSGTSWNSLYINTKPRRKAIAHAKYLEILSSNSPLLIRELSNLPPKDITEAEWSSVDADEARERQMASLPFGPSVEHEHPDAVITNLPESGPIDIDVPVMIGYNSREGIEMSERLMRKPQYLTFVDRDFVMILPIRVDFKFKLHSGVYKKAIQEIKDFYFEEGYVKVSRPGEYLTYIADIESFYPIDYTVRKYTNESRAPVYYYTFDYSGELNMRKNKALEKAVTVEGTWGATLGDELCYLFVCKPIRKTYKKLLEDEESEEIKVLKNMVRLWSYFAKSGNPSPPGSDFTWTPARKDKKDCLVINEDLEMKTNLHQDRIDFWDDFLARYQKLAVDGVISDRKDEL